jgi:signal transduction histidine kinase
MKRRYDDALKTLAEQNIELIEKTNEIETQNEELMQSHENLNNMNMHLESLVHERTREVQTRNEQLVRFAYSNAHDVRGPVARVLGLIQLSKMEADLDYPFLFKKIEEQTKEIDEAVKGINRELEKSNP